MTARVRRITPAEVSVRARHAHAFLDAAELILLLGDDAGIEAVPNLIGSLAVLSGIAAADAICGEARGERAGESHLDAVDLLRRSVEPESAAPSHLKRLLTAKSTTQYSGQLVGRVKAFELLTAARRLVECLDGR